MVESRRKLRTVGRAAGRAVALVAIVALVAGCAKTTVHGSGGANGDSRLPDDACSLLSPAEVSMATGYTVGQSTHPIGRDNLTCHWDGPADEAGKPQWVELVLDPGATQYKEARGDVVIGVGDHAFADSVAGSLWVKWGNDAFSVIDSATPSGDTLAVETTLAKYVLPRL